MKAAAAGFAINTYSYIFSGSAADIVARLADQGYGGVELMFFPGHLWPAELDASALRKLRNLCEQRLQRSRLWFRVHRQKHRRPVPGLPQPQHAGGTNSPAASKLGLICSFPALSSARRFAKVVMPSPGIALCGYSVGMSQTA